MGKLPFNFLHRVTPGTRSDSPNNTTTGSVLPTSEKDVVENKPKRKPRRRDKTNNNTDSSKFPDDNTTSPSSPSNSQAVGSSNSPSLGTGDDPPDKPPKPPLPQRAKAGSKRFWKHTKNAVFRSWFNLLLIFVPVGIAAEFAHLQPEIVFAMNAIAIIPLAGLLTHATESVAVRLGDTLGALLNVSFGNAVELIIFIIALVKNEIRIVQASLLGSLLANLLLILGMAFAFGGLRYQEQIYNSTVTQMSACLLSLSVMSLLLPTAFHYSFSSRQAADRQTLKISRGVSVVLLLVYVLYLIFQLKSHAYLYQSMPQEKIDEEAQPGVLAEVWDTSSSSSSSSSSDSNDTDTTSGSHTTVKRIKRAFRHRRRRKSSASHSEETRSVPSAIPSPPPEDTKNAFEDIPRGRRGSLGAIMSGDEGDVDEIRRHNVNLPKVRDFEKSNTELAASPEGGASTNEKHKQRKKKQKKKSKSFPAEPNATENQLDAAATSAQSGARAPRVDFVEPTPPGTATSAATSKGKPATHWRPGLPKLMSQNVFVDPHPVTPLQQVRSTSRPRIRRASSLPDLTRHISTVPGRGFRPTQIAPPAVMKGRTDTPGDESEDEEEEEMTLSRTAAVVMLLVSTGLVALCAEFLVSAIPAMTGPESGVSEAFIGLIILPIVGNAAEHVTAVTVAMKNKMDLAIGVAVGSSIQIGMFLFLVP